MTEQKIFPFLVNGEYWKSVSVDERSIMDGFSIQYVTSQLKCSKHIMPDTVATMKRVFFQLVECGEQKHGMVAHWVSAFWVCDDELELDNGHLYLKFKEPELVGEKVNV